MNNYFFALGFFSFYGFNYLKQQQIKEHDLGLFWQVWNLLEEKYPFEEPTENDKIHGAIAGLVDSYGDEYSTFFPPAKSEFFNQTISGEFGGIGVEIGIRAGYLTVIAPLKDSPGENAGLLPGDIVTEVDGVDIAGMTTDEAIALIRGEKGTEVVLSIRRFDSPEPLVISIIRDIVVVPVIDTDIKDDTFIISLYNFNEMSEEPFKEAVEEFKASDTNQLILDLRNNPGGFLTSAIDMASYFIEQGKVVVIEQSGLGEDSEYIFRSTGHELLQDTEFEMIVLINEGSASASEILAGALRDHNVARVAGERSYGKGSVQELIDLPQKTSLKVTISEWLTPNRDHISKVGIEPDVYIPFYPETSEDTQLLETIELFDVE